LPAKLRYVDPTRPPGVIARAYAAFAATGFARLISRHINWKLDPILLRVTRGRLATTLVFPTAVLETQGARSGARRRNAIIYFHDGDRVTIAASNAGTSRHPAWYHNLRAHPDVTFGGIPMRAVVVNDEAERERLWVLADRVFPAFASYRHDAARANRSIPIVQLTRRQPRRGQLSPRADADRCFVFDGDCGFCRRWAGWLQHRLAPLRFVPFQELDLSQLGLTAEDVQTASYFIEHGRTYRGGRGIARAMTHGRGIWRLIGVLLDLPGVRFASAAAYRLIVRNRHRLPTPHDDVTDR